MANLMEGLIEQTNRAKRIASEYDKIPAGAFGAAVIRQDIATAEAAMGSGDVIAMLAAYETLKGIKL